jgi:hypothetical protein
MFREVSTPDGVSWRVEIDWMARRIRNPVRRSLQAARERFAAIRRRRARKKGSGVADAADLASGLDDILWVAVAIVAIVVLFFFFVWVAPVIWAVLGVLLEFFFVTLAALVILVWRTVLRRPWRVVARRLDGDDVWSHEIVGYRAARRRVGEVAADIRAGMSPGDLGFVAREPST